MFVVLFYGPERVYIYICILYVGFWLVYFCFVVPFIFVFIFVSMHCIRALISILVYICVCQPKQNCTKQSLFFQEFYGPLGKGGGTGQFDKEEYRGPVTQLHFLSAPATICTPSCRVSPVRLVALSAFSNHGSFLAIFRRCVKNRSSRVCRLEFVFGFPGDCRLGNASSYIGLRKQTL